MKVRLIHAFLGVGAVLLAGCAQDRTITRGLKGAPQLRTTLVQAIPLGSDLASAVAFMERNQFRCLDQRNAAWGDRQGLDYVHCDKEVDAGWPILRRWQVALVHVGSGQVQEVLVSTGLVGP
jgi:hypothetical protein